MAISSNKKIDFKKKSIEEKINNIDKNVKNTIKKDKSFKKSKYQLTLQICLSILLVICLGIGYFVYDFTSNLKVKDISSSNLQVNETIAQNVKNIALFGLDFGDTNNQRSDSIIILSIDYRHNSIKLSSILRDSYVDIDKHGKDKINHAYVFGGPALAVSTLNKNFKMDIEDYVSVDFSQLIKLIDFVGGVTIDVSTQDFYHIQGIIDSTARDVRVKTQHLKKPGVQVLNGLQAVSYSRIRKVGNGDFERTSRQREVLEALLKKALEIPITSYYGLVKQVLSIVETSLSLNEILQLASVAPKIKNIEQYRVPSEQDLKDGGGGKTINGIYYLVYDLKTASTRLHDFIENGNIEISKPEENKINKN